MKSPKSWERAGMGVVYKARDLRLERFAALKFLAAHLLDSAAAKTRFLQEARVISRLAHPNIAVLYEVGEYEGDPFLAFEYLPGGTLRALLIAERENGRRLPLEDAVGFASPKAWPTRIATE
jgi:serine/threonine protein kinase